MPQATAWYTRGANSLYIHARPRSAASTDAAATCALCDGHAPLEGGCSAAPAPSGGPPAAAGLCGCGDAIAPVMPLVGGTVALLGGPPLVEINEALPPVAAASDDDGDVRLPKSGQASA